MESILSVKTKIICPNWRETAAFYRDHFAMEVVEEWDEAGDKGVVLGLAATSASLSMTCLGGVPSGLPMPRSTMSSPLARAPAFIALTSAKT